MSEIQSWSVTAASNNSASPDGWPESMAPSGINNSARENMAAIARWYKDGNGSLSSGGSANAYTLSPNRTIAAYAAGIDFLFLANHANTGAATLNVSSLGAKDIRDRDGVALTTGDIESGSPIHVVYDNTNGYFRATNIVVGTGSNILINDLSDVAISSASANQVLRYDGSSWVNSAASSFLTAASTSAAGIVELATGPEAAALTDNSLAITPYALQSCVPAFVSTNGYQGLTGNGKVTLNWGYASVGSNTTSSVSFTATVANGNYGVFFTIDDNSSTDYYPLKIYSTSTTGFTVINTNAATLNFYWIAIGARSA